MSDVTPAEKSDDDIVADPIVDETPVTETAADEPSVEEPSVEEPHAEEPHAEEPVHELVEPAAPVAAESSVVDPVVLDEPTPASEHAAAQATGDVTPAFAAPAAAIAPQQVVYLAPPVPPKKRGNRGIGILLAVVGAIIFAAVYAVVAGFLTYYIGAGRDLFGATFVQLISSTFFWTPVAVFLVGLILLVLVLNRSGWWAHVLGSLVLAVAVYFGTIGVLLFIGNVLKQSPDPVTFIQLATNALVIAAAVVAREASIWIGLAIAARGRRVKARNVEARAAFDREQEAKRAEHGGAVAA